VDYKNKMVSSGPQWDSSLVIIYIHAYIIKTFIIKNMLFQITIVSLLYLSSFYFYNPLKSRREFLLALY
jgi:hypothetical protein